MTTTTTTTTTTDRLAFLALLGLRAMVVHTVTLALLLGGYRPPAGPAARLLPAAVEQPVASTTTDPQALTVAQLRILARQAGHKALARSGRRADLLAVLG